MVKIISDDIPWLVKGTSTYKLFTDPPAQPPIPKYILSSLEPDDASPQRRIASRGTELFVATGCEIRCVDLRILKAQYETEQQSKGKKNQNVTQSERGYQVGKSGKVMSRHVFSDSYRTGLGYSRTRF